MRIQYNVEDGLDKYADFVIAIMLGIAFGYLISGMVSYRLNAYVPYKFLNVDAQKEHAKVNNMEKIIISNNVLGIDTGIARHSFIKQAKVVSSINGYVLVGFISGKNPMALFKKGGKAVAIVTKKAGLGDLWVLDKIDENGVYLKNKKTKENKQFKFPHRMKQLSFISGSRSGTSPKISSNVEKITITRNMLNKVSDANKLFKEINIAPLFKNGATEGYKINYISRSSILRKVGLKSGDVLISINGEPTTNPSKIMELYSQIKNMTGVNIDILRNGIKKTIFIDIK